MPGITTSIAPLAGFMEVVYGVCLGQVPGPLKIPEQMVALGIQICGNVVSDLTSRVA